jgi:hypothetical protein
MAGFGDVSNTALKPARKLDKWDPEGREFKSHRPDHLLRGELLKIRRLRQVLPLSFRIFRRMPEPDEFLECY